MPLDPFVAGLRGELKSVKGSLRTPPGLDWRPLGGPLAGQNLVPGGQKSKFLVTPVGQNGLPTDPEPAPNCAKQLFSGVGRWRLAGAGPRMPLDPFVAGLRGELKSSKGSLRTRPGVSWRPRGRPRAVLACLPWLLEQCSCEHC